MVTCKQSYGRGVGIVDDVVGHFHTPVSDIIGVVLVIAGMDLHIFGFKHIIVMDVERYNGFGPRSQAGDGQRVMMMFGRTHYIQIDLYIVLGL